ncbi:polyprenyl synthetase family protein, partial [Streptomyces sp. NPDC059900]
MASEAIRESPLDLVGCRRQVVACLREFFAGKEGAVRAGRLPQEAVEVIREFVLAGGKRLRPLLCLVGWTAGGGCAPTPTGVVRVAASLEVFHAFALIHDDIIDGAGLRRGQPAVHCQMAARHAGRPDAAALAVNGAMLLGDLALVWSDELLATAPLVAWQRRAIGPLVGVMREELAHGQYLDLLAAGRLSSDLGLALQICRAKTARYTIEHPLLIGATLAGAGRAVTDGLSAFAVPLGDAFQLRDDLLDAFGDPAVTGKPACGDLRAGKPTVLTALALQDADAAQKQALRAAIGAPADAPTVSRARTVLEETGARVRTERMIAECCRSALDTLQSMPLPAPAVATLRALAAEATTRT